MTPSRSPESRVQTCNDELFTIREAMRGLNMIVRCIEEGLIDKAVLTRKGKMVVAIVPLKEATDG
jgi:hypothetical protein